MAKKLLRDWVFTPGVAGVGTIKVPDHYTLDKLLLITNVTDNIVLYNFADTTFAGTTAVFTDANSTDFPQQLSRSDGYTTITLQYNTSAMNANDSLQIYVEANDAYGTIVRPWDFGTDAIERARVSSPSSLIDADFEYGLQPTKWAGYGTIKGYPSAYDLPGIDLTVDSSSGVITDYTNSSTSNSRITVTFTEDHGLSTGDVVNMSGLDAGIPGFSRADGNFVIESVPSTSSLRYRARGVVGSSNGQDLYQTESIARRGKLYQNAAIPVSSATSSGGDPSTITLNFTNPHGLIPGTPLHVNMGGGTNKTLGTGPFFIKSTPTDTSLTYIARAGGAVSNPASITLYAFSNSTILHRPSDGGVILSTKSPTYAASVVRQSKRYFRYQSGKGLLFSTGTLLAPNYDLQSVTASGTAVGSTITVKTDDIDHGLQPGANVSLEGVETSGYDNEYIVNTIVDDYTFTVLAVETLGDTMGILTIGSIVHITGWTGAAVRAGVFDEQNGIFFEFNGQELIAVLRSATLNLVGTVGVTGNSNSITGVNTKFSDQLRAGDRIVIRGMTHYITRVDSNTQMYVTPDYRGITASGIRSQKITEKRIRQSEWNLDKVDGTGQSGYNWNVNKMQMLGIEWSWYGAGFVHWMIRGSDGKWIYVHRQRNNNLNNEAYMRSSNLPVRYSIDNDSPVTYLTGAIDSNATTIPVAKIDEFSTTGTVMIDNEIISYTGKSTPTGAGNFTGATREATLTQYMQGTTNALTAGGKTPHSSNTGIIEISNTCSPTLSHWGSSLIMDGGFERDRGYLFTYAQTNVSVSTTPVTAFAIRLAPSVSNASVGRLGAKELLNRSQMLLENIAVSVGRSGGFFSNVGEIRVQGILNPRNFESATWKSLNGVNDGGQPSFAQVADLGDITWDNGTYAQPGEAIFSFVAASSNSGASVTGSDLTKLKEMSGAPLGGDFQYPDGPDILAINISMVFGSTKASCFLRWIEAQA